MFALDLDLDIDEEFENPFNKDSPLHPTDLEKDHDVCQNHNKLNDSLYKKMKGSSGTVEAGPEGTNVKLKKTINNQFNQESSSANLRNHTNNAKTSSSLFDSSVVRLSCKRQERYKENVCSKNLPQRIFPGPAGILPDKPPKDFNDSSLFLDHSSEEVLEQQKEPQMFYSQSSASMFTAPPYRKLIEDFGMNDSNSPLNKYTIEWVKKKALRRELYGSKIPFLAVVLHHLDCSTPDPVLTLRDPTGEIYGTLHREVWSDKGGKLHPGAAIVLRQVGVVSTGLTRRQVCLNITINNIVTIYSSSEILDQVEASTVHQATSADLLKSIEDWKAQARSFSSPLTPLKNSPKGLFASVLDKSSPISSIHSLTRESPSLKKPNSASSAHSSNLKESNNYKAIPQTTVAQSNFDLSFDEHDFDDAMDFSAIDDQVEKTQSQASKNLEPINFVPKFEIKLDNKRNGFAKPKDISKPSSDRLENRGENSKSKDNETPKSNKLNKIQFDISCSQQLTQKESQICEEVLSGIDFDDFEL